MLHTVLGVVIQDQLRPFKPEHLLHGCLLQVESSIVESRKFEVRVPSVEFFETDEKGFPVYSFAGGAEALQVGKRFHKVWLIVKDEHTTLLRLECPEQIRH